jgi:hypothetical protein
MCLFVDDALYYNGLFLKKLDGTYKCLHALFSIYGSWRAIIPAGIIIWYINSFQTNYVKGVN